MSRPICPAQCCEPEPAGLSVQSAEVIACIVGMGDVLSLVESAQAAIKEDEAEIMTKRIMENKFDFNDFRKQSKMMSRMGTMGTVMKMLPGMHSDSIIVSAPLLALCASSGAYG